MSASLVLAQPQDQRKCLEAMTETSTTCWIGKLTSQKQSPGATPHHVQQTVRQDMATKMAAGEKERLPFIGGIEVRLAHQLPGKPAEEPAPYSPSG